MTAPGRGRDEALVFADLGMRPPIVRLRWADLDREGRAHVLRLRGRGVEEIDVSPWTEHLCIPGDAGPSPVAYLRLVRCEGADTVLDLVADAPEVRHLGLTSALLADALARYGADALLIEAPADHADLLLRWGCMPGAGPSVDPHGPPTRWRRSPDVPWRRP